MTVQIRIAEDDGGLGVGAVPSAACEDGRVVRAGASGRIPYGGRSPSMARGIEAAFQGSGKQPSPRKSRRPSTATRWAKPGTVGHVESVRKLAGAQDTRLEILAGNTERLCPGRPLLLT